MFTTMTKMLMMTLMTLMALMALLVDFAILTWFNDLCWVKDVQDSEEAKDRDDLQHRCISQKVSSHNYDDAVGFTQKVFGHIPSNSLNVLWVADQYVLTECLCTQVLISC